MNQSNTRVGDFKLSAGVDLRGKEGHLVKIVASGGKAVAVLPNVYTDVTPYLVLEGADVGDEVTLRPLSPERNVRVRLVDGCNAGAMLVLADMISVAHVGQVRQLPSDPGTYQVHLVAEESGVNGQWVLARPVSLGLVSVN